MVRRENEVIQDILDVYGEYRSNIYYTDKYCVVCKKAISGTQRAIKGFNLDENCYKLFQLLKELESL
jgi:hypothetical protein